MNLRLKNIYAKLGKLALDGLIVSSPANISYLTKYTSRDSYLLVSKRENIYLTDSRYIEEAREMLKGVARLIKINGSCFKLIADTCIKLEVKRVGFEERHLPFAEYAKIKEGLKKKADLVPTHSLIEGLRQIKENQEIEKIRRAIEITSSALKFAKSFIAPGKKEIEVVAELERFIRYRGASKSGFDIIVAFGANSSQPHHIPTEKKLEINEPVLIDIGVDYLGYKSDLTRVFFLGKINTLARKIYDIVRTAQDKAIKQIKPGKGTAEIDAAARKYITQEGFGLFFGHNLGHGVGLEVHEEPHISKKDNNVLRPGMVFTIEPAIYLPQKFGIRIEDMVLVTQNGCEVLSGTVHK
jgi:Xaa-Pro aminopeptidase